MAKRRLVGGLEGSLVKAKAPQGFSHQVITALPGGFETPNQNLFLCRRDPQGNPQMKDMVPSVGVRWMA